MAKLIAHCMVGWTGNNPLTRNVGILPQLHGTDLFWYGFIKTYIIPAYEKGFRRFLIHNPFGCLANEDMQLDQYIHASTKTPWLVKNFAKAFNETCPTDIEIISYLGTPITDRDFEKRLEPGMTDNWLIRVTDSLKAVMDAKHNIGWDYTSGLSPNSHYTHLIHLLTSLGHQGYIEAWPCKWSQQWFNYPNITTDNVYDNMLRDIAGNREWAALPSDITGEIIRMGWGDANGPYVTDDNIIRMLSEVGVDKATWTNTPLWYNTWIKNRLDLGHSVCVSVDGILNGTVDLKLLTQTETTNVQHDQI
jgi:hypothetical protein